ncbi:MAG: phytanoyl-CoA dioxygenase family protein [Synechococcus sp.]
MVSITDSTGNLTDDEKSILDFYRKNGYVGPFSLSDRSLAERSLLSSKSVLLKVSSKLHDQTRNLHVHSRVLFDMAVDSDIAEKLNLLLGPDLLAWTGHFIRRKPGNLGQKWHIDQTNYNVEGIHTTVALTEMNQDNGCLKVIPGSHNYGITNKDLDEFSSRGEVDLNDPQSVAALADKLFPENAPHPIVSVETKPNQFFFTKGGLWHGVSPNHTSDERRAMVIRYMKPEMEIKLPCVLATGSDEKSKINSVYETPTDLFQRYPGLNYWINYLSRKTRLKKSNS